MIDVNEIFFKADNFYQEYEVSARGVRIGRGQNHVRVPELSVSEMMTIMILFHQSHYRDFKAFYRGHVQRFFKNEFPKMVSYSRFVQLMPRIIFPLLAFLNFLKGRVSGLSFIDSTSIAVCKNKRISRNKVFKRLATIGKTTMGWFFGFKLHFIINDSGEIISWAITKGHVDDRHPVPALAKTVKGKLFGDKGYSSQPLFEKLFNQGTQLITSIRSNMKNKFMPIFDRILLRKRSIIETINDQLKNISQIEHSRHRSPVNFLVNLIAALSAYQLKPKKPSFHFNFQQLSLF